MKNKDASESLAETVRTVIYAVIIALVVRTFIYEPFNIPSGSMVPTLLVGDYLFVSKYSYGYSKHSLPCSAPLFDGRVFNDKPERGDVAVFKLPKDNKTDYIKRIIGYPGDKIQTRDGRLYINSRIVEREKVDEYVVRDKDGSAIRFSKYIETLPNGYKHPIIEYSDSSLYDNTGVFLVPPKHYFVMGDNRDNSTDSRDNAKVGFVPVENLVGRAEVLFYSNDGSARWWEFWKWPMSIRFHRLFQSIE